MQAQKYTHKNFPYIANICTDQSLDCPKIKENP